MSFGIELGSIMASVWYQNHVPHNSCLMIYWIGFLLIGNQKGDPIYYLFSKNQPRPQKNTLGRPLAHFGTL